MNYFDIDRESYEWRTRIAVPENMAEVEGTRRLSRSLKATARFEIALFEGRFRTVEPGCLAVGVQRCVRVVRDPGSLTRCLPPPEIRDLAIAKFALCWSNGTMRRGSSRSSQLPEAGAWAGLLETLDARAEAVEGAALVTALRDALGRGFTPDEIDHAFGRGSSAAPAVREAVVSYIMSHAEGLSGRQAASFHDLCASSECVKGFTTKDLGPHGHGILAEELGKSVMKLSPSACLGIADELLGGGS